MPQNGFCGENSKSFGWIYKMLAFTYNKLIYKDASFYYLTHKQRNVTFSKFKKEYCFTTQ